ncbi:MAG TPA: NAD(P)/FAD-dependent oxidoreductase [Paracoccus sp. (in: a-proteobacteria)]|nr:NAD(P)/FAD-dependent oxidoreductase [Paracoccus sp. (in: a-proteobacteria)]
MTDDAYDCLIVGGGPAGLTAAIYLARFHRRVLVVDKNEGRMSLIPLSHNYAGYPQGVVGTDLLERMRNQARDFGAELRHGEVTALHREGEGFRAGTDAGPVRARRVLLATGVVNLRPPVGEEDHDAAVARGLLRYCPICDAYEQTGKRIGVLGADRHALAEALFLRTYSPDIVMVALHAVDLDDDERTRAKAAGIRVVQAPVSGLRFNDEVTVHLADGTEVQVDTLYVALGSRTRNDLGTMMGTELCDGECFVTDDQQRTSAPGIYAAGDAVEGLDQISSAMGTGAQAAVAIHNDLREMDGHTL